MRALLIDQLAQLRVRLVGEEQIVPVERRDEPLREIVHLVLECPRGAGAQVTERWRFAA